MATKAASKKAINEKGESSLVSQDPAVPKPRLRKLIVTNFRAITSEVSIDLDDIVVLVGPNNCGKSSILKAYELAMSQGSSAAKLTLEDFPDEKIDPDKCPEIELITSVYDNSPGERWIDKKNGENLVREKWKWPNPGDPVREGYDVVAQQWDTKVPWGAPNIANSRRPLPHRIDAFASPTEQANEIIKILTSFLTDRVKAPSKGAPGDEQKSEYEELLVKISEVQKKILEDVQNDIKKVEEGISKIISEIFPSYSVEFDARPESVEEKSIQLFKSGALKMGPNEGYKSTVDRQGSGARRTLLWSALKFLEDNGLKTKKGEISARPHLLLMDEPEICLHPSAIRDACQVLYDLPKSGNWQVMITTHSPAFIDLSRDNTTIVRVERAANGVVTGTTLYRPQNVKLDIEEKRQLKLLNIFDPYVAEFFFGQRNIIVEGDTEYTALKYVISLEPKTFTGTHVIRARGKATIVSLAKILNQFSTSYSILHDSDKVKTKKGVGNPAWKINQNIIDVVRLAPDKTKVRLVASKINFENAFFDSEVATDKPYNAFISLKESDINFNAIKTLLIALIDFDKPLPTNTFEWKDLDDLQKKIQ